MTINQIMQNVPGLQEVDVRMYIGKEQLEIADANAHCEFMRNNCCVGFDKNWEVYSLSVVNGVLTIEICPPPHEEERMISVKASRLTNFQNTVRELQYENKRLNETADMLESSHRELLETVAIQEKALAEKEQEVLKLKAMLFDRMYGAA